MTLRALTHRHATPACALLLGLLSACRSGSGSQAATDAVWWESAPVEVDVNADSVADFVALCTDPRPQAPPRVCAADGATFGVLWRSEPLVDVGDTHMVQFGLAGDRVVLVDALATLHAYDLHTGKSLPVSHRFAERARRVCSPREHPGKLWIETEDRAGWLFDPATMKPAPLPEPRSCLVARCWSLGASDLYSECEVPLAVPGWSAREATQDGDDGIAVLTSITGGPGDRLAGFKPGSATPRWVRTIPPVEPLKARNQWIDAAHAHLAGGRVVASYEDIARKDHLVAIDAKTGEMRWDVITNGRSSFTLSATRIYEPHGPRLDVRDAATGKLLGGVGALDYK
jgi:outer membrane protein assembly factor BamB